MAQGHVYTLELKGCYFYVGHSLEVETRIAAHFLGNGAMWTRLHRPVRVLAVTPGDTQLENLTCIALMCQHGHERVRGGKWCLLEHKVPAAIRKAMLYQRPSSPEYEVQALEAPEDSDEVCEKQPLGDDPP